jgi:hypothetical protein
MESIRLFEVSKVVKLLNSHESKHSFLSEQQKRDSMVRNRHTYFTGIW